MFCAIVTVGLLLTVVNVTFIQLLLIIIAFAILMPFLLGLVTVAEVRTVFSDFKEKSLRKNSLLKKLDDIKLFEKKSAGPAVSAGTKPASKPAVSPQTAPAGLCRSDDWRDSVLCRPSGGIVETGSVARLAETPRVRCPRSRRPDR